MGGRQSMLPNMTRGVPRVDDQLVLNQHPLGAAIRRTMARSAVYTVSRLLSQKSFERDILGRPIAGVETDGVGWGAGG